MRPSLRFALSLGLLLSLTLGCFGLDCGGGTNVVGPPMCSDPLADGGTAHLLDGGAPAALTLTIGDEASTGDQVMTPWTDGASLARVHGTQGGTMLTPALDVVAPAGTVAVDASGNACFHVHVANVDVADPTKVDEYDVAADAFAIPGRTDAWHVTTMADRLIQTIDSSNLDVTVTVTGATSLGTLHVRVMPH